MGDNRSRCHCDKPVGREKRGGKPLCLRRRQLESILDHITQDRHDERVQKSLSKESQGGRENGKCLRRAPAVTPWLSGRHFANPQHSPRAEGRNVMDKKDVTAIPVVFFYLSPRDRESKTISIPYGTSAVTGGSAGCHAHAALQTGPDHSNQKASSVSPCMSACSTMQAASIYWSIVTSCAIDRKSDEHVGLEAGSLL